MNPADILVIVILLLAVAVAIAIIIYRKKHGSSCCGSCADCGGCGSAKKGKRKNYSFTVDMTIGGMTCRKCAMRVETALSQIGYAKVDFSDGRGVLCTDMPDEALIRKMVSDAGYVLMTMNVNPGKV